MINPQNEWFQYLRWPNHTNSMILLVKFQPCQAVRGGVRVICRIRPFVEDDARGTQNCRLGQINVERGQHEAILFQASNHRHFWRVQTCCKTHACPRHISKRFTLFRLFRKRCPGHIVHQVNYTHVWYVWFVPRVACFLFFFGGWVKFFRARTGDFEDMEEGIRPTVEQAWSRMRISQALWAGKKLGSLGNV